ncbi:GNAT family N-acetyltransferase [Bacillus sp. FJAT-42315]|uniref:GNAT family N-acetyltransferase n=1 Tax=Bacillus sp. FJAT-42315 TaxID=2014077 RepID=UPI000C230834|nr:GNAT family N-acetyltransferase [Bacillus sp. FJAT-42315]
MVVGVSAVDKYQTTFQRKGLELRMLRREASSVERIVELLKNIESEFLFPTDSEEMLHMYAEKLTEHAYNFVLMKEGLDVGLLSVYANDFTTKTAFCSTIGLLPSYRGGYTIVTFIKFGIEFLQEAGMKFCKAEVSKDNTKWIALLDRYGFRIESETNQNSYIIVRDLANV